MLPLRRNHRAEHRSNAVTRIVDVTSPNLPQLLQRLQEAARFPHPVRAFELIETHISYVLLTGDWAYKFKKPIDLGFVDFSTLEKRRFFCHEELRLNRRLAPQLYDAVVSISGTPDAPHIDADPNKNTEVLEYAVRMRQFPTADRLDKVCGRGELRPAHIDQLADRLAAFHRGLPSATDAALYGSAATLGARVMQNFDQIAQHCDDDAVLQRLQPLKAWSEAQQQALHNDLCLRQRDGWIRECHGDLHLANCALVEGEVVMFDALEFAADLRWIDPLSEIAFLYMDLEQRGEVQLARRFLNRYLENADDYQSLTLLPYYLVYRALVRAKVAAIEAHQHRKDKLKRSRADMRLRAYLEMAEHYSQPPRPAPMILMHGPSGSGKSLLAKQLVEQIGALCIRSDVERKRLLGLDPTAHTASDIGQGAYSNAITDQTYARLRALAYAILDAGIPVIIDATFLRETQRNAFHRLASVAGIPFTILTVEAPEDLLRQRISNRDIHDPSEATLAVLEHQLAHNDPLSAAERPYEIKVDSRGRFDVAGIGREVMKGR